MYLTAQRVRAADGNEGINCYLYQHDRKDIPGMSWEHPDIALVADRHPGAILVQRIEQEPGDNEVLSFLDVAVQDSHGLERLRTAMSSIGFDPTRPSAWSEGPLSFRFSFTPPRDPQAEWNELVEHTLLLLHVNPRAKVRDANVPPLEIEAEDVEGVGVVYRLPLRQFRRLNQHRPQNERTSVRVAYEDRQALASLWGGDEYHRQIALGLTGLTEDELAQLGGAVVVDARRQLTPQTVASAEEITGQVLGDWYGPDEQVEQRRGWPTGALLRVENLALDLVYIERAWFPMSEAALHTYQHSAGLLAGEPWRFVVRSSRTVFRVSLGPAISHVEVANEYGADAGARCRKDKLTVQLRLAQE
jgi:hypothetical protein